ncbi:MAG: heparinase II/III family protein, partial [Parvularculaceae bacterium]
RGEDRFVDLPSAIAGSWRLRFHLHPGVRASLARDGKSVILALPNREGWRFRANAPSLRIEKSIYCGEGGLPVATEQIVLGPSGLEARESGDMVIKWAFRRVDAVGAGDSKTSAGS